jgi:hypothetical protein
MRAPIGSLGLIVGGVGAVLTLLALIASGSGDHKDSYHTYLIASAIVFASCLIAAAIKCRGGGSA